MDEFDALLGDPAPPAPNRGGRPSNEEREARRLAALDSLAGQAALRKARSGQTQVDAREFLLPVSQNFLARVLRMDPMTVGKRLLKCKPLAMEGGNRPVYDFKEAIEHLVKPKMDIATYLRTLNPAEMPNSINKVYWEAERIKNKTLLETGEAWATADVLEVLGSVFMTVKNRIPIILEAMRDAGLTDAQVERLRILCDQFGTDLHGDLVEMPRARRTPSRRAELEERLDEMNGVTAPTDPA